MAAKKTKQEEALQFLDDLDSFAPPPEAASAPKTQTPSAGGRTVPGASNEGEAAEVLAFLDEITQKSTEPARISISRSGTPTIRKSTERVRLGGGTPSSLHRTASSSSLNRNGADGGNATSAANVRGKEAESAAATPAAHVQSSGSGSGWGWGSVSSSSLWSTATAAIQQAKTVVDEQVKHLPKNEQARKWGEGVLEYAKTAQLDKISQDFKRVGLSTLTDILNVVAPPISEHEVIQVWLTHDMQGYEGVESLAYKALARVLEQVQGGDLVVNRGNESRPKDGPEGRDLNAVEGYETALKVSQVNVDDVMKKNENAIQKTRNDNSATTYSHVFLRIQPFFTNFNPSDSSTTSSNQGRHLQFLIYMFDPAHKLTHTTLTQVVPTSWLAVWDEYDWVEDLIAETLRVGVEVLGQEYVVARMGWGSKEEHAKDASASVDPGDEHKTEGASS